MTSATRTASCAALLLATLGGFSLPASADSVADFYKGKRISMFVGSEAGGGYDAYARLVTRHLGKFIPGNPEFIVQNMPGGGGLRVTNNLYNVAAKDGTAMGTVQRAILTTPLLDARNPEIHYDPLKFKWLGSLNTETGLVVVWNTAPHKDDEGPVRAGVAGGQLRSHHRFHAAVPEQRARNEVQDHLRL